MPDIQSRTYLCGVNLCIDIGNTRAKAALFDGKEVIWSGPLDSAEGLSELIGQHPVDHIAMSSVAAEGEMSTILQSYTPLVVNHNVPLPIKLNYLTPESLGSDRICAAVGGFALYPGSNVLTIDIGTCIKYEVISEQGEHLGGNIAPGMQMRFRALNDQTAALPLVTPAQRTNDLGLTTEQAIRNGVQLGILCELEAMIGRMSALLPSLKVVLTGGDHHHFENDLKTPIFAHPLLVLKGLNEILLFNHQN